VVSWKLDTKTDWVIKSESSWSQSRVQKDKEHDKKLVKLRRHSDFQPLDHQWLKNIDCSSFGIRGT